MNNPEYILVDVFGTKDATDQLNGGILYQVKEALELPVLNYQYGYITELNETLKQWNDVPDYSALRFPLVWLRQPFTIQRGIPGFFGEVQNLSIFIINETKADWKASDRMENNFKPVLYPIYRELLNQIDLEPAISYNMYESLLKHQLTDRYYWGEEQQNVLNDFVDCLELSQISFRINNNPNNSTFKNF